jgi:hypothetical protein
MKTFEGILIKLSNEQKIYKGQLEYYSYVLEENFEGKLVDLVGKRLDQ